MQTLAGRHCDFVNCAAAGAGAHRAHRIGHAPFNSEPAAGGGLPRRARIGLQVFAYQ